MAEPIHLPSDLRQSIVRHCIDSLPNEGCGLLAVTGDRVSGVYPTANDDASPSSFTIPPAEHYAALARAEALGWQLGGSFHSHPWGEPRPSDRDLEKALEPDWVYLIVGLEGQPDIKAWEIRDQTAREVSLVED